MFSYTSSHLSILSPRSACLGLCIRGHLFALPAISDPMTGHILSPSFLVSSTYLFRFLRQKTSDPMMDHIFSFSVRMFRTLRQRTSVRLIQKTEKSFQSCLSSPVLPWNYYLSSLFQTGFINVNSPLILIIC